MKIGLSLNRQFIIGTMIVLMFSLVLSISLISIFQTNYRRAENNLSDLLQFRQLLIAANSLSAERGPVIVVLGEEPTPGSLARNRLIEFRARSDAALASLLPDEARLASTQSSTESIKAIEAVKRRLEKARQAVDALADAPRSERSVQRLTFVLDEMFDVIEVLRPAISTKMTQIVQHDESLAGPALMAQMFGDLREYAGRVGSYVAPSLAAGQPMSAERIGVLRETIGRIRQIWQLTGNGAGIYGADEKLAAARSDINSTYFGIGLPLIEASVAAGQPSGDYRITASEFIARYVPTMAPIERLRSSFLDITVIRPAERRNEAEAWLVAAYVLTALIIAANILLLMSASKLVFGPLMLARDHIIALAEGRDVEANRNRPQGEEMRRLFDALDVLQVKLSERFKYTERLKIYAQTDGLTGMTNRHLLDQIGRGDPEFDDLPTEVGLIMLDIDHFKSVNDTYGHTNGDRVLKTVAKLVRDAVASDDVVARFGGEEFAIVVSEGTGSLAAQRASTIRLALAAAWIDLDDGRQIQVTASLGVAMGRRGSITWPRLVEAADSALYRAKMAGRNRVCIADDAVAETACMAA